MVAPLLIVLLFPSHDEVRRVPLGLDLYRPVPEANPLTPEKVALGRRLFFDKRLSRDRSVACATCHRPKRAFTDGRQVAMGFNGRMGTRNTPTLINRVYGKAFFLDGRASTHEKQAIEPILNPREMNLTLSEIKSRTGLESETVAMALASYIRTIVSGDSRYDRHVSGATKALSAQALSGLGLFRGKARCSVCHVAPNLTDDSFHNTGIAWRDGQLRDPGRFRVTGRIEDRGSFKVPTLREVAKTAPYMHDGSLPSLEAVVDYYDRGGNPNPGLDEDLRPLHLTAEEKRALLAFLKSLSGRVGEGEI